MEHLGIYYYLKNFRQRCQIASKLKNRKFWKIPKIPKIPNLTNISKSSNAKTRVQLRPSKNRKWARTIIFNFWRKSDFFFSFLDIYGAIFKFDLSALNAKMSMIERPFWKLNSANWNWFKKYTWTILCRPGIHAPEPDGPRTLELSIFIHNADVSKNVFINLNFM